MDDRTLLAGMAMEGILIGAFGERPNAKPPPKTVAGHAVAYADALRETLNSTADPCASSPTPKV